MIIFYCCRDRQSYLYKKTHLKNLDLLNAVLISWVDMHSLQPFPISRKELLGNDNVLRVVGTWPMFWSLFRNRAGQTAQTIDDFAKDSVPNSSWIKGFGGNCRVMFPWGTHPTCQSSGANVRVRWIHQIYPPVTAEKIVTPPRNWKRNSGEYPTIDRRDRNPVSKTILKKNYKIILVFMISFLVLIAHVKLK